MATLESKQAVKVKRVPHVARDFNGKSMFLRFDMPSGLPRMKPFSRVLDINLVTAELLEIVFPEGTFEVEGQNLIKLFPDLQNEHVRALAVYDSGIHSDPAETGRDDGTDPDPVIISNIVYVPDLPSDLPPM